MVEELEESLQCTCSSAKNSSFFYEQKQIHWNRLIILHLNYLHCLRASKPLRHVGKKKRGKFWGPFLESPGNFSGPKSNIQIEI